jgi:hypothetical protein
MAFIDDVVAERFDECRLSNTGRPRDSDAHSVASCRKHGFKHGIGNDAMLGSGRLRERYCAG